MPKSHITLTINVTNEKPQKVSFSFELTMNNQMAFSNTIQNQIAEKIRIPKNHTKLSEPAKQVDRKKTRENLKNNPQGIPFDYQDSTFSYANLLNSNVKKELAITLNPFFWNKYIAYKQIKTDTGELTDVLANDNPGLHPSQRAGMICFFIGGSGLLLETGALALVTCLINHSDFTHVFSDMFTMLPLDPVALWGSVATASILLTLVIVGLALWCKKHDANADVLYDPDIEGQRKRDSESHNVYGGYQNKKTCWQAFLRLFKKQPKTTVLEYPGHY